MNTLDVYDAVHRYLSERLDNGLETEIYDIVDLDEFMVSFDEWMKDVY